MKFTSALITQVAWIVLVLSGISMLFLDSVVSGLSLILLFFLVFVVLWLTSLTWLLFHYHTIVGTSYGLGLTIALFVLLNVTKVLISASPPVFALIHNLLLLTSFFTLSIVTILFLYKHDEGLKILGWGSITAIWAIFLWWRTHPNFIIEILATLAPSTNSSLSVFSILDIVVPIVSCVFPVCILSFIGHTIRLLYKNFIE